MNNEECNFVYDCKKCFNVLKYQISQEFIFCMKCNTVESFDNYEESEESEEEYESNIDQEYDYKTIN